MLSHIHRCLLRSHKSLEITFVSPSRPIAGGLCGCGLGAVYRALGLHGGGTTFVKTACQVTWDSTPHPPSPPTRATLQGEGRDPDPRCGAEVLPSDGSFVFKFYKWLPSHWRKDEMSAGHGWTRAPGPWPRQPVCQDMLASLCVLEYVVVYTGARTLG